MNDIHNIGRRLKQLFLMTIYSLSASAFAADPLAVGLDNLQPGHWYEYNNPNSKMSSVDPCPDSNCGFKGAQSRIMVAWGGGAFDTARNRLFIWGGGHNDYAGNELYYFDLEDGAWTRVTDPSADAPFADFDGGYYPDGLPQSRHTYNHVQFDPVRNWFISLINAAPYGPQGTSDTDDVDVFDMNTRTWMRRANRPRSPSRAAYRVGSGSAYDANTGLFWHYNQNEGDLASYDPATDSWRQYGPVTTNLYTTADIDLSRNLMVVTGGGHLQYVDLDKPRRGAVPVRKGKGHIIEGQSAPGFVYDRVQKLFVAWGGTKDPAAVYTLDPDDWSWSRVAPAASNTVVPSAAQRFGTYGRFRYVPEYNIFVLVNSTRENVFLYKLSDGSGVTPALALSLTLTDATIKTGDDAALSWSATNADSCVAGGDWSGSQPVSGTTTFTGLTTDKTYSLTCTGAGETKSDSVTVTVNDALSAQEEGGDSGGGGSLHWLSLLTVYMVVLHRRRQRSRVFHR